METKDYSRKFSDQEISDRLEKSRIYHQRLGNASRGLGYHNCAGLAKFILGLSPTDAFVRTGDPSEKGIIKYLEQVDMLHLEDFNERDWVRKSQDAAAVAILHNDNHRWQYLHFMIPDPDLSKPFDVFQRNGFEEEIADIGDIREIIRDDEYKGDSRLVFFSLKKQS